MGPFDHLLTGGGLDGAGLHEVAVASASWSDDAAATLFAAGIAARIAAPGLSALWALTRLHLYASGLEQAGLAHDRTLDARVTTTASFSPLGGAPRQYAADNTVDLVEGKLEVSAELRLRHRRRNASSRTYLPLLPLGLS